MGIAFAFSFRLLSCLPESQCIIVAANLVDLFRSSLTRGLLMVWALQKPPVVATEKLLPSSGCFSILKHFKKVMNVLENQATNHWQVKKALCEFIYGKHAVAKKKKWIPTHYTMKLLQVAHCFRWSRLQCLWIAVTMRQSFLMQMTKQSKPAHLGKPWQFAWQSKDRICAS